MCKVCTKCNIKKEDNQFTWYNDKGGKRYQRTYCHQCQRDYFNRYAKKNYKPHPKKKYVLPITKKCKNCEQIKPISYFSQHTIKSGSIVADTYCKVCANILTKKRYEILKNSKDFKEKNRKRTNIYYHNNKEHCTARNRNYQKSEEYKAIRRERYHKNKLRLKEVIKEATKRYNHNKIKNLTDQYIIIQMEKEGIPRNLTKNNPLLIEAKRLSLLIKRKIKNNE